MAAGLDSLGSVEFVNVLARRLQLPLPATLIFDHPTANAVAQHLHAQMRAATLTPATATGSSIESGQIPLALSATTPNGGRTCGQTAVAILATAQQRLQILNHFGAFPTAAAAVMSTDAITSTPLSRREIDDTGRFGAFMEGVEHFDAAAFGLTVSEATFADPQHRLLLSLTGNYDHPCMSSEFELIVTPYLD